MNDIKKNTDDGAGTPTTARNIEKSTANNIADDGEKIKHPMKVLIACEESQRVCAAFRKLGHEAYSCDIQEPSGGHPEWHIIGDALKLINGNCQLMTIGGGYSNS